MANLPQLDPGVSLEAQAERLREFMQLVEEGLNRVETVFQVDKKKTDTFALSTSLKRIPGFDTVFRSGGGLTCVEVCLAIHQTVAPGATTLQLRVDGITVRKYVLGLNTGYAGDVDINYEKKLSQGDHKLEIYASADAGTTTINGATGQESYMTVKEV